MMPGPRRLDPMLRFVDKIVVTPNGCWLWTGATTPGGYGQFNDGERTVRAHRWSYAYFRGPVPLGLVLDHLCRTPSCVNHRHLDAVTNAVNVRRGTARCSKQTHCIHGHEFTPENTVRQKGRGGRPRRRCRTCEQLRNSRRTYAPTNPGAAPAATGQPVQQLTL